MPFNNRLQFDKQWDFTIPIILCTFLGLAAHIDLLVRVMIFWNLPNRNFNTFIAQLTFTSHDESWENLFVDIHIDRQRSDRVNPTPGRSPYSSTLQYVRNQRSHPDAPPEPQEDTSDEKKILPKKQIPLSHKLKHRSEYPFLDPQITGLQKPSIMNETSEYHQCRRLLQTFLEIHHKEKW